MTVNPFTTLSLEALLELAAPVQTALTTVAGNPTIVGEIAAAAGIVPGLTAILPTVEHTLISGFAVFLNTKISEFLTGHANAIVAHANASATSANPHSATAEITKS